MHSFKVDFESIEWNSPLRGVRFKVYRNGAQRLRLVEFAAEFVEPDWCTKGHIGFVLAGALEVDFQGDIVSYPEGSGIFIPAGASSAHKARSLAPVTRLVLVEDV